MGQGKETNRNDSEFRENSAGATDGEQQGQDHAACVTEALETILGVLRVGLGVALASTGGDPYEGAPGTAAFKAIGELSDDDLAVALATAARIAASDTERRQTLYARLEGLLEQPGTGTGGRR